MAFLDLPAPCRYEIYALSGLVRPCPIDIKSEHLRVKNGDAVHKACNRYRYHSCTYLNHLINSDIPRTRRREGQQFVCFGPELSLSLLRVSKEISLEASRMLYSSNKFLLRVEQASDLLSLSRLSPHAISSLTSLHVNFQPNSSRYEELEKLLHQWSATIQAFAKHITPSQLSLALTYQSANGESVGMLLGSIKCLPRLRNCALSIGAQKNQGSSVEAVGTQLMGRKAANPDPFPFERLPKELRLQILRKTDLVQHPKSPSAYGSIYMERYDDWKNPRNKCCSRCNDCLESCCCIWNPAAYSPTCVCHPLPISLFLAGRQISNEAQEIFYSENIFILTRPLSSIAFIEGLNSFQLSRIRRLELFFRENDALGDWDLEPETIKPQWSHVIGTLRTRLNLEKLELRVNLARFEDLFYTEELSMDEVKSVLKPILHPLKSLSSIHKLFLYFGYYEDLETEAEKEIMGQSYDPVQEGKPPEYCDFVFL